MQPAAGSKEYGFSGLPNRFVVKEWPEVRLKPRCPEKFSVCGGWASRAVAGGEIIARGFPRRDSRGERLDPAKRPFAERSVRLPVDTRAGTD